VPPAKTSSAKGETMTPADVLKLIQEEDVKFVDLRFTDTIGKEQHVTVPASEVDQGFFEGGKMFDGSSIAGWKDINESDMILMPEAGTSVIDVFAKHKQLNVRCDVVDPLDGKGYERDPRSCGKRAMEYLRSTGIADNAFFGPENEFFVFDDVKFSSEM
jgi:glutamine synthetase